MNAETSKFDVYRQNLNLVDIVYCINWTKVSDLRFETDGHRADRRTLNPLRFPLLNRNFCIHLLFLSVDLYVHKTWCVVRSWGMRACACLYRSKCLELRGHFSRGDFGRRLLMARVVGKKKGNPPCKKANCCLLSIRLKRWPDMSHAFQN